MPDLTWFITYVLTPVTQKLYTTNTPPSIFFSTLKKITSLVKNAQDYSENVFQ